MAKRTESACEGTEALSLRHIQQHWLSNLAHDLRGPLFAARGYVRMVLENPEGNLSDTQRRYLATVSENLNRAVALVQETNDFPELFEITPAEFNLSDAIEKAVAAMEPLARNKNVVFSTQIAQDLFACGDEAKLADAMQAFLTAAVEITAHDCTIHVVGCQDEEKVVVRISAPGAGSETRDLHAPSRIIRLHGGATSQRSSAGEGFRLQFDLPRISE